MTGHGVFRVVQKMCRQYGIIKDRKNAEEKLVKSSWAKKNRNRQ